MRLPDVNVLVNAFRVDAPRHRDYRQWLTALGEGPEPFAVTDLVLSGFLRVVTHHALQPTARDLLAAREFVDTLRTRPNCVVVAPGPRQWAIFRRLCDLGGVRGKLVADAFHAATAIEWGHDWITDDADFARFPGLRWRRPLDL